MKNTKILSAILIVSGLVATLIGGALLVAPAAFEASAGIEVGDNISLLSELRAPGGALLSAGVLIGLGAFVKTLTLTSSLLAALLYLSYGLSRVLSLLVDGRPADSLLIAMIFELVMGLVCLLALMKYRRPSSVFPRMSNPEGLKSLFRRSAH